MIKVFKTINNKTFVKSLLYKPLIILHSEYVSINNNVRIFSFARIETVVKRGEQKVSPEIIMDDNVMLTSINHIYTDVNIPVINQLLKVKTVGIGEGTFVCTRAEIMPYVKIGKHCVIANCRVITKNISDHTLCCGGIQNLLKCILFLPVLGKESRRIG